MVWLPVARATPNICRKFSEILYIFRKFFFFHVLQCLRFVQIISSVGSPQPYLLPPPAPFSPSAAAALWARASPAVPPPCPPACRDHAAAAARCAAAGRRPARPPAALLHATAAAQCCFRRRALLLLGDDNFTRGYPTRRVRVCVWNFTCGYGYGYRISLAGRARVNVFTRGYPLVTRNTKNNLVNSSHSQIVCLIFL